MSKKTLPQSEARKLVTQEIARRSDPVEARLTELDQQIANESDVRRRAALQVERDSIERDVEFSREGETQQARTDVTQTAQGQGRLDIESESDLEAVEDKDLVIRETAALDNARKRRESVQNRLDDAQAQGKQGLVDRFGKRLQEIDQEIAALEKEVDNGETAQPETNVGTDSGTGQTTAPGLRDATGVDQGGAADVLPGGQGETGETGTVVAQKETTTPVDAQNAGVREQQQIDDLRAIPLSKVRTRRNQDGTFSLEHEGKPLSIPAPEGGFSTAKEARDAATRLKVEQVGQSQAAANTATAAAPPIQAIQGEGGANGAQKPMFARRGEGQSKKLKITFNKERVPATEENFKDRKKVREEKTRRQQFGGAANGPSYSSLPEESGGGKPEGLSGSQTTSASMQTIGARSDGVNKGERNGTNEPQANANVGADTQTGRTVAPGVPDAGSAGQGGVLDIVLLDIQMQNLDGVSAAQAIRQGKAGRGNADIPIIALTAYAMIGDKEKFYASGFDGYLAKPVNKEEFSDLVHQFVEHTSA